MEKSIWVVEFLIQGWVDTIEITQGVD